MSKRSGCKLSVADTEENVNKCICKKCPIYPGEGILFCARGKRSKTPKGKGGCICIDCLVWQEHIRFLCQYCIYGSADKIV